MYRKLKLLNSFFCHFTCHQQYYNLEFIDLDLKLHVRMRMATYCTLKTTSPLIPRELSSLFSYLTVPLCIVELVEYNLTMAT